jgi:hypothetical protein
MGCKQGSGPDIGAFVRAQIVAKVERGDDNPIWFYLPDGAQGRVWLGHDERGAKVIDDERASRCHLSALVPTPRIPAPKCEYEAHGRYIPSFWRHKASESAPKPRLPGFKVRIVIESEKELQVLGCGWRVVTCQFRGDNVLLHHAGNTATMKRKAFKELVEATRRARYGEPRFVSTIADEVQAAA